MRKRGVQRGERGPVPSCRSTDAAASTCLPNSAVKGESVLPPIRANKSNALGGNRSMVASNEPESGVNRSKVPTRCKEPVLPPLVTCVSQERERSRSPPNRLNERSSPERREPLPSSDRTAPSLGSSPCLHRQVRSPSHSILGIRFSSPAGRESEVKVT